MPPRVSQENRCAEGHAWRKTGLRFSARHASLPSGPPAQNVACGSRRSGYRPSRSGVLRSRPDGLLDHVDDGTWALGDALADVNRLSKWVPASTTSDTMPMRSASLASMPIAQAQLHRQPFYGAGPGVALPPPLGSYRPRTRSARPCGGVGDHDVAPAQTRNRPQGVPGHGSDHGLRQLSITDQSLVTKSSG